MGRLTSDSRKKPVFPPWAAPALIYAISLGCLIWVYHDFHWRQELGRVLRIHWLWILLAVSCDVAVYVIQAWRWNLLLAPLARVPLWRTVRAIYIGLFANEMLPFRAGEAIRCYLQSRWSRIPFSETLSSAIVERLVDGAWLIIGLALTTILVERVPARVQVGLYILVALVVAIGALVAFAVFNKKFAHHVVSRHRWTEQLRYLVEGFHVIAGAPRSFFPACAVSLLYVALQVVPIYAIIRGYGEGLTLWQAGIVMVVLRLGTVVPGPPSNVGVFNAFAALALRVIGKNRQTAAALSGLMFFSITIPLLVGGILALIVTGVSIQDIHLDTRNALRSGVSGRPVAPGCIDL